MLIATVVVSILLAVVLTLSSLRKLTHRPEVVEDYAAAGVPEDWLNTLAVVLFAGAAGLVVGLAWAPLGIAAGACLIVYFLVATWFHVHAGEREHLFVPLVIAVIAAVALALRIASM